MTRHGTHKTNTHQPWLVERRYECPKAIYIETGGLNDLGQAFSVANDCLTPSFKLRRYVRARTSDAASTFAARVTAAATDVSVAVATASAPH
jgi:hypothetical protein